MISRQPEVDPTVGRNHTAYSCASAASCNPSDTPAAQREGRCGPAAGGVRGGRGGVLGGERSGGGSVGELVGSSGPARTHLRGAGRAGQVPPGPLLDHPRRRDAVADRVHGALRSRGRGRRGPRGFVGRRFHLIRSPPSLRARLIATQPLSADVFGDLNGPCAPRVCPPVTRSTHGL